MAVAVLKVLDHKVTGGILPVMSPFGIGAFARGRSIGAEGRHRSYSVIRSIPVAARLC